VIMGALMFENSCTSMQMNKLDTISGTILGVFLLLPLLLHESLSFITKTDSY